MLNSARHELRTHIVNKHPAQFHKRLSEFHNERLKTEDVKMRKTRLPQSGTTRKVELKDGQLLCELCNTVCKTFGLVRSGMRNFTNSNILLLVLLGKIDRTAEELYFESQEIIIKPEDDTLVHEKPLSVLLQEVYCRLCSAITDD